MAKTCWKPRLSMGLLVALMAIGLPRQVFADENRFDALANLPFANNRPTDATAKTLKDELLFQRATQTYLWAMPLLNTMGMRDGSNDAFGTGYNVMEIWEKRLDAKTQITTPNSDLIYGMTFANLARDRAAGVRGAAQAARHLLDFWQRPIPEDGGKFFGDVGLPGPDAGAGGKFLILPPGYKGRCRRAITSIARPRTMSSSSCAPSIQIRRI